jgi:hypothetical protein
MVWQEPHTNVVVGGVVDVDVVDPPNAVEMAWSCSAVSVESGIIPLIVLMPVCIWVTVAPLWPLVASGPWHPLQYVA